MEAIAVESGYAVQTIYFHFKSKAAILVRLLDELLAEEIAPRYDLAMAATSAPEVIRLAVAIARATYESGWDLMQVLGVAAKSEPGLAARLEDWEGGRVFGTTSLIHRLAELGALRDGVEEAIAVDIWWTLAGPEVYRLLRVERGWEGDAYEAWLASTLARELCAAPTALAP